MKLILEIYEGLDVLRTDIKEFAAEHEDVYMSENTEFPIKVELPTTEFKKLEADLLVSGTYEGIRHREELMSNKWNIEGVNVMFINKPEKK